VEKARLDGLTLDELLAEFRAEGQRGGVFSSGKSQYRGISMRYDRWQAKIKMGGKTAFLGYYSSEEAAAAAYDAAAWSLHGRFINVSRTQAIPVL
jgi:hypothetical protein